jgi:hypothetical protein
MGKTSVKSYLLPIDCREQGCEKHRAEQQGFPTKARCNRIAYSDSATSAPQPTEGWKVEHQAQLPTSSPSTHPCKWLLFLAGVPEQGLGREQDPTTSNLTHAKLRERFGAANHPETRSVFQQGGWHSVKKERRVPSLDA